MPGSLQNRLQQLEVAPPPIVWDKISSRLDQEFVNEDIQLSSKLENVAIDPPASAWDNIAAELDREQTERPVAPKVIPLIYRRIAIAALFAGVVAIAALYLFTGNDKALVDQQQDKQVVVNVPDSKDSIGTLPSRQQPVTQEVETPLADNTPIAATRRTRPRPVKRAEPTEMPAQSNEETTTAESAIAPEEAPLYELHTVSALQPVSVSAPPIRDKKGNLILDLATIRNPRDPYIVVTGPNGKQTKMSTKFLACLGYINVSSHSDEVDPKALRCRAQFEEWRKRLITDATFIPTANNFFDIFELKDMIQDM